jgi:nucleoside-diphosphate-sugar epimerase
MFTFQSGQVLVTGASGFIGSHLLEGLLSRHAGVRALVRYSSGHSENEVGKAGSDDDVEVVVGDLRDLAAVQRAVKGSSYIFHVGGLGCVPYSLQDPLAYLEVNVRGTANILQAAYDTGVERVVFMSSSEVYGEPLYNPVDEGHVARPRSPYAASKLAAEALAMSYYLSFGLPITIVRGFNVYGPRQPQRNLIPALVRQAIRDHNVRVGDLQSRRDYIYVTDVVEALLRLAVTPSAIGGIFNVGSGAGRTAYDLVAFLSKIMEKELTALIDPAFARPRDLQASCLIANTDAIGETTGWRSTVPLEQGLTEVVHWHRRRSGQPGPR